MFCEQCEQTASGNGCHQWGACGKSPQVNAVQDLTIYCLRGLAYVVLKAKELNIDTHDIDVFTCETIFATMTNVNFDQKRFTQYIRQCLSYREGLKTQIHNLTGENFLFPKIARYQPDFNASLVEQGQDVALSFISENIGNNDIFSLKLTVLYGLKGLASYNFHAQELGQQDEEVYNFIQRTLTSFDNHTWELADWVNLALEIGKYNLKAMELLDAGHTQTYGHPTPTTVPLHAKQGKAILVSGHDIRQLAEILAQTAGKGINVYTHGELLPAHGYPRLKEKYPHFYGHYGTAWQNQTKEFARFPGAVIVTTNCLMPPQEIYEEKLFTIGPVGYGGINYLAADETGKIDYSRAIAISLTMDGFREDEAPRQVMVGFGRNAVLSVGDQVIDAIKQGKLRHIFLVGGCDGAKPERNYYTEFVEKVPQDCVVLTLACGKFRFFDQDLGTIGNLPRLMDVGQCNDAYSAIQIAIELAKAFEVDVNQLPLSMILSWYEQKAVAVLLSLLYLGIQDIRLGPTLPAFISPNVFKLLSEKYNLKAITTPDEDLAACLV
ncbi:MAG: hydroxylamine reductase [Gloeocapsa sp. DLM2.Bin57]|nr:MAG: hydroxylamine reductase [Gloeocapsa sp. DLM2.Bin57]